MSDTVVPSAAPTAAGATRSPTGWQRELAEAFRDPVELCRFLGLEP
jgi:hypothetical protein